MKHIYISLVFSLSLLLVVGCKPSDRASSSADCAAPRGTYVNQTVLKACPGSFPADIPHYMLELKLTGGDSLTLDNGYERFDLPLLSTENGCTWLIKGATLYGDMEIQVTSDSTFTLLDTAWTKAKTGSEFALVRNQADPNTGFEELLNDCVFESNYAFFHKGEIQPRGVDVLPNGQLNGMRPYIGYRLCYAGDCLETTNPPSRTIDLIDDHGQTTTFAIKQVGGTMSIEFYSISDPLPDVKGERTIGEMVYEWRSE